VVALRLAGLSGEEIAAAMGKRHATVRKLQERAIRKLTAMRLADASRGGKPA
jgi:DNA-directed RNA polymerase specialized sigma24 family protein